MITERELLPIPEFGSKYAISRTQIYREIKAGRLRLTKRGARSFICREDAQNWLEALRQKSSAVIP